MDEKSTGMSFRETSMFRKEDFEGKPVVILDPQREYLDAHNNFNAAITADAGTGMTYSIKDSLRLDDERKKLSELSPPLKGCLTDGRRTAQFWKTMIRENDGVNINELTDQERINNYVDKLELPIRYLPDDKRRINDLATIVLGLSSDDNDSYWLLRYSIANGQGILVVKPKDNSGKLYAVNKSQDTIFFEEL